MATLWKKPEPVGDEPYYSVQLPGLYDALPWLLPKPERKAYYKERILDMITRPSPVPESLKTIPTIINKIDNAQDIFTTALWIGKKLIRKIPQRYAPIVGWALTANDIANLATFLLGTAMTPALTKADLYKQMKKMKFSKKDIRDKLADFLKPGGWRKSFGNWIQAAQAADTITGVGLSLGAIMGAQSDLFWGALKAAQGKPTSFRLPPYKDPMYNVYRFLTQTPEEFWYYDLLTPEEHGMILAVHNLSTQYLLEFNPPINDQRINELMDMKYPTFLPSSPEAVEALEECGFNMSLNNYYKPHCPQENLTFGEIFKLSNQYIPKWIEAQKREIGTEIEGYICWLCATESAFDTLEYITGLPEDEFLKFSTDQKRALTISEYNFTLKPPITKTNLTNWFNWLKIILQEYKRSYPTIDDCIMAADFAGVSWTKKW